MEKKIIVVCGEPSGDLQAGLLVSKIKELDNTVQVYAVGGEFLKKAGARLIQDIKGLSVLGLFDALRKLKVFKALMRLILDKIQEIKPEAIIFVDFAGFNLRLAKRINKNVRTIYYISPQVWVSRQGRVQTIKKFIDKLIVIFEFERDFYKKFGIEAEFVGHPLLDIVKPGAAKEELIKEFGLSKDTPIFALLPGSRISEISHILPIMRDSAEFIKKKIPNAQFIISKPPHLDSALYKSILSNGKIETRVIDSRPYDCLEMADFVLVASGTATLETAIMQRPNAIIYKMGIFNYLLYRPLVKVPFIGMENIVAKKLIAPEFIQTNARPKKIADTVLEIFQDKEKMAQIRKDFIGLKEGLGNPQAPLRAAQSILAFINSSNNG
jgi:lipid-A-disaccharide synthase